jgi:hypothetical protein
VEQEGQDERPVVNLADDLPAPRDGLDEAGSLPEELLFSILMG